MLGQQQTGGFTPFRGAQQWGVGPKKKYTYTPFRQKGRGMGGVVKHTLKKVGQKALTTGLTMLPYILADLSQGKKPSLAMLKHHGTRALKHFLGSTAGIVKQEKKKRKVPLKRKLRPSRR